MSDSQLTLRALPFSGAAPLKAYVNRDLAEVKRLVNQAEQYRQAVTNDFLRSAGSHSDQRRYTAELDKVAFSLAAPISLAFQQAFAEVVHLPGPGLFEFGTRTITSDLSLRLRARQGEHPTSVLAEVKNAMLFPLDRTFRYALPDFKGPFLSPLLNEFALSRRQILWLLMPKRRAEIQQMSALRITYNDMHVGAFSGIQLVLKLIEVFPRSALASKLPVRKEDMRRSFVDGPLLTGLARQNGQDFLHVLDAFVGCDICPTDPYSSEHKDFIGRYASVEEFVEHHAKDMWYTEAAFAMYGPRERPVLGTAKSIHEIKAESLRRIAGVRHHRMGCPLVSYEGIQLFAADLVDVCSDPLVWEVIVAAAEIEESAPVVPLLPVRDLNRKLHLPDSFAIEAA